MTMLTNEQLQAALDALPGARVTREYLERRVAKTEFFVLPDSTVTVRNLTLDNGFSVRGESACVDPANFRKEIGEKVAYERALDKLWPLFGFLYMELTAQRGS